MFKIKNWLKWLNECVCVFVCVGFVYRCVSPVLAIKNYSSRCMSFSPKSYIRLILLAVIEKAILNCFDCNEWLLAVAYLTVQCFISGEIEIIACELLGNHAMTIKGFAAMWNIWMQNQKSMKDLSLRFESMSRPA